MFPKSRLISRIIVFMVLSLWLGLWLTSFRLAFSTLTTPTAVAFLPIAPRPFPFTKSAASPFYLPNFANNAGCHWLGVAGEVLDQEGQPVPDDLYNVHVWGSGINTRPSVGGAPAYGPSGWEQFLFDSPVVRSYLVQLETVNGRFISPIYPFQTHANCDENLVRFDFVQHYNAH